MSTDLFHSYLSVFNSFSALSLSLEVSLSLNVPLLSSFIILVFLKNWPFSASFTLFSFFHYTVDSKQMFYTNKLLPMTGFEPRTSGTGSDRSTNWATTTARHSCFFVSLFFLICTLVFLLLSTSFEIFCPITPAFSCKNFLFPLSMSLILFVFISLKQMDPILLTFNLHVRVRPSVRVNKVNWNTFSTKFSKSVISRKKAQGSISLPFCVSRLGDLLDFWQLFKAFGNN